MVSRTIARRYRHLRLLFPTCLLVVLCLSSSHLAIAAPARSTAPVLNIVVLSGLLGDIMVSGHGFTPGGQVYVAVYDQWGMVLHETRWVTASTRSFQPPQDLALGEGFGFDTGGNIADAFALDWAVLESAPVTGQGTTMAGVACAAAVMVRAYDRSTASWSAMLDVDLGCLA